MKKKKMRKALSVLLVVAMLFTSGSMTAFAEESSFTESQETVGTDDSLEESSEYASEEMLSDGEVSSEEENTESEAEKEEPEETKTTVEESSSEETESSDEETENDVPEETASQETEETEITTEETETTEETTTEETETEETTTEETETEETTTEEDGLFTGLPENYVMSKSEKEEKASLASNLNDIKEYEAGIDYVKNRVVFLADTQEEAEEVAKAFDSELQSYSYGVAVITLPKERTVMDAVTAAADSEVKLPAVWPDYIMHPFEEEEIEEQFNTEGFFYNDPYLKETSDTYQWQHAFVGSNYAWAEGKKGAGVKVAIIDTGLLKDHDDLRDNVYADGEDFTNNLSGAVSNVDTDGHGTHVSGIIGAQDSNGIGGCGIAPDAQIRGYRVFNDEDANSGSSSYIMRAISAAVSDGNDIINMSLGGAGYSTAFQNTINDAVNSGVVVFAAAGNESTNGYAYPASYNNVYSIAALQPNGTISTFSNYTATVDFAFPGVDIYSTYYDGGYYFMSGTSQATPVAAGVAAVILGAADQIKELKGKTGKARVDAVGKVMKSAAIKASSPGTGAGYTYLPKALKISYAATAPNAPTFTQPKGTYTQNSISVGIKAEYGMEIYYSTDGKNPSYKNGIVTNGIKYEGKEVVLTGAKTVTLKAIAINSSGKASKVASISYTLQPIPTAVEVVSSTQVKQIAAGKSLTLKANITPDYSCSTQVKWSVSPEGTGVTVSNKGVVKAAANASTGEYTITAQAVGADKKNFDGAKGTFTVTVIAASKVKSIVLAKKTEALQMKNNNPTVNLAEGIAVTYTDGQEGSAGDVIWSSNNTKIATVDSTGKVTAQAPGSAVITALASDGSGKKATCKVTITSLVSSIDITGSKTLAQGGNITLSAAVNPVTASKKTLTWTVEPQNSGVTVKNGKVTASKTALEGSYSIKAVATDGSGTESPVYEITVIAGKITSIDMPKTLTLFTTPGNSNAKTTSNLGVFVKGDGAFKASCIEYKSSAPGIASVDASGLVTAHKPGKATITCQATDGSNKKSTCTVSVNVPMSKLTIAPTNGMTKYIARGKSVTYSVGYGKEFGNPTNTKVVWSSDNESIATVKNGKVTGKSTGVTYIKATALDGSGVVASYQIKVVEPATYFYLGFSGGTVYVVSDSECIKSGVETGCIKITVPAKKVGIVKKYINGADLAFFKKGTQTIKITLLDGSNKSATIKVKVR